MQTLFVYNGHVNCANRWHQRLLGQAARSLSNNSFLETKNATQYPAYSNRDFVVELLTSLHSPNYAYRLEYCLSDRLLDQASNDQLLGT